MVEPFNIMVKNAGYIVGKLFLLAELMFTNRLKPGYPKRQSTFQGRNV
jgi:hypothetical protein